MPTNLELLQSALSALAAIQEAADRAPHDLLLELDTLAWALHDATQENAEGGR